MGTRAEQHVSPQCCLPWSGDSALLSLSGNACRLFVPWSFWKGLSFALWSCSRDTTMRETHTQPRAESRGSHPARLPGQPLLGLSAPSLFPSVPVPYRQEKIHLPRCHVNEVRERNPGQKDSSAPSPDPTSPVPVGTFWPAAGSVGWLCSAVLAECRGAESASVFPGWQYRPGCGRSLGATGAGLAPPEPMSVPTCVRCSPCSAD